MSELAPPLWLERLLAVLLTPSDRETITGDLLEEYREEVLPKLGTIGAGFWYGGQIMSFARINLFHRSATGAFLATICLMAAGAGIWLCAMENILNHPGHVERTVMDAGIVAQALLTLLFLAVRGGRVFRLVLFAGALAILWLGVSALWRDLYGNHFEGFVAVIGVVLIVQAALTSVILSRRQTA